MYMYWILFFSQFPIFLRDTKSKLTCTFVAAVAVKDGAKEKVGTKFMDGEAVLLVGPIDNN